MRKILLALLLVCLFCPVIYAQPIERVQIEPLVGGVSFNTITFAARSVTGWVTAPSVEMVGRKEVMIRNTSSTDNVYLTGVSGSTVTGTLQAGEHVTFKAASSLHVYVSSNTVATVEVWEIR